MFRLILFAVLLLIVATMFWRLVDAVIEGASGQPRQQVRRGVKLERDPVCGTYVTPSSALSLTSGSTTRYFCSEKCRDSYQAKSHL